MTPPTLKDRALSRLPAAANDDGEFSIAARLWEGDLMLVSGDDAVRIVVRAGRITEASPADANSEAQIRVVGPADGWAKMLLLVPPPFYQDLFAASAHHGFAIHGPIEDIGPYYPALRRLIELLRAD
jgi:hypothetical protein